MMLSGSVWRLIVSTCAPSSGCQQQQKQPPRKVGSSPSSPPMILLSPSLSFSPRFQFTRVAFLCFLLSVFHCISLLLHVLCPTLFPEFFSPSLCSPFPFCRHLCEVMPLLFVWVWSSSEQKWKLFDKKNSEEEYRGRGGTNGLPNYSSSALRQFVPSRKLEDEEPSCFSTEVNVSDRLFHILTLDAGRTVSGNPAGAHINDSAPPRFLLFHASSCPF